LALSVRLRYLEIGAVAIALAFVIASLLFPPSTPARNPAPMTIEGTGFQPGGVYTTTDDSTLPAAVPTVGSWLGGDGSIGLIRTPWRPVSVSRVFVFVAGYPNNRGMDLHLEVRCGATTSVLPVVIANPGEHWREASIDVPSCATAADIRLVARDGSSGFQGWLGTSDVLASIPGPGLRSTVVELLRLLGSLVLAFVLVFVPGLVLARRFPVFSAASLVALPGLTMLFVCGLFAWRLLKQHVGATYCSAIVLVVLVALLWRMIRDPLPLTAALPYRRVFAVAVCVIIIAAGRSLYSLGPANELYGGTISRTLEPGDRSDSRISFHVVQLAANGAGAYGALAQTLLSPWTFSDRGPIAGFIATPIVMASGGRPPDVMPDQRWLPFDPQGFAAYRAAMFVLASTVFFSLFGLVAEMVGGRAGLFAVAVAALAPFVLHETWFTWPKIFATSMVLVAAYLVVRRRVVPAGAFVGVAYLIHPSALFAVPALLALVATLRATEPRRAVLRASIMLIAGPIATMILWRVLNGDHYSQAGFFGYIVADNGAGPGIGAWIYDRAVSLANTLIPLWLPLVNRSSPEINGLGGVRLSLVDHLEFAYWCTLPFGLGLLYVVPFTRLLIRTARRALLPRRLRSFGSIGVQRRRV
jgi:hypothetical protein